MIRLEKIPKSFWMMAALSIGIALAILHNSNWLLPEKQSDLNRQQSGKVDHYIQTCDHCGSEFEVSPDADSVIKPTVEWCFYCGRFCQNGLDLIIDIEKSAGDQEAMEAAEIRMMEHCKQCFGCRAALFNPEQWNQTLKEYEDSTNGE